MRNKARYRARCVAITTETHTNVVSLAPARWFEPPPSVVATMAWAASRKKTCSAGKGIQIQSDMARTSIRQVTRNEGVVGEKEEVMSVSVGSTVNEPEGGTKVMTAKMLLVTVASTGGTERRRMSMASVSRSGHVRSTVSGRERALLAKARAIGELGCRPNPSPS